MLQWLRIDPRSFQPFVMHRVGEILEHSNLADWKWLPTKMNPAAFATKTSTQKKMDLWFNGTAFLRDDPSQWQVSEDLGEMDTL